MVHSVRVKKIQGEEDRNRKKGGEEREGKIPKYKSKAKYQGRGRQ